MSNLYASLTQLRNRLDVESTDDNVLLLDTIEDASRYLDEATGRRFYPRIDTLYYDHDEDYLLRLDDDLLSVTTLTTQNDGQTIASTGYYLMCGGSYNAQPYTRIAIKRGSGYIFGWSDTPQKANKVVGVWGHHNNYAGAYRSSGDTVLNNPLSDSGTSVTVANGHRFEAGQTLKIGSEWLYVSAVNGNVLTVERGVNGSTAAEQAVTTAIYIYEPMRDAQRVALRFAGWLFKQYAAPHSFEIQTSADGTVIIPQNAPPEVHRFVKMYRRAL